MKSERWYSVCEPVKTLPTNLQMYASYLESQNELSKKRQSQMTTSSDVDEAEVIPATSHLIHLLATNFHIKSLKKGLAFILYSLMSTYALPIRRRQYEYNKELVVPVKCVKYTYTGSRNHLTFLWKVPIECSDTEQLKFVTA